MGFHYLIVKIALDVVNKVVKFSKNHRFFALFRFLVPVFLFFMSLERFPFVAHSGLASFEPRRAPVETGA